MWEELFFQKSVHILLNIFRLVLNIILKSRNRAIFIKQNSKRSLHLPQRELSSYPFTYNRTHITYHMHNLTMTLIYTNSTNRRHLREKLSLNIKPTSVLYSCYASMSNTVRNKRYILHYGKLPIVLVLDS